MAVLREGELGERAPGPVGQVDHPLEDLEGGWGRVGAPARTARTGKGVG